MRTPDTVTITDAWGRPVSISAADAADVVNRYESRPGLLAQSLGLAVVAWMTAILAMMCMGRIG